ncbi:response regulator [Anaerocolumna sedimenticola]|uniref:Stage 0 sporulation protein A homolog n=1 Tax=Anaerocolumna sedimenticola TaxID=2696063 RepID=A0A6P1TV36_9FIRM|nr:response regulator transcription factor [Anaerocolumna sedimenticola]QHQ63295.1 response regulator [Anaerocolumna sedimenticola]
MEQYHILVIDDEVEIVELIEIYLLNEGYQVLKAFNGSDGIQILEANTVHLVILDIMMPGIDGLATCRKIRQFNNIPIIMLSAKTQDMDKILGLGTGADDYMIKPFNPMELIARVKSQLRRHLYFDKQNLIKTEDSILNIKGLVINKKNHQVLLYGKEINLTPTEFDILVLLAGNAGTVFNTEEIFERVWKEKYFESNNTVMVHIWRLREKIEENPKEPKIIETVWGVGYKIEN